MSVPSLSRTAVDRAAAKRDDVEWQRAAWQAGRLLTVDAVGRAAVDSDGPALIFTESGAAADDGLRVLLGIDEDDTAYWGTVGDLPERLAAKPLGLREVGAALSDRDAGLLVTMIALSNWHTTHQHCPNCGAPTVMTQAGWSRRCDIDGSQHFPRTDPAVIVLLHDGGDRALLGRQPSWPPGRYSTIAGFVEAGESAEQCVHREVQEETGAVIDDVRYQGSQPWPFPASLMLGYEARVIGGDIEMRDAELEDVRWFDREELRNGEGALPPSASIAHWLITSWLERS